MIWNMRSTFALAGLALLLTGGRRGSCRDVALEGLALALAGLMVALVGRALRPASLGLFWFALRGLVLALDGRVLALAGRPGKAYAAPVACMAWLLDGPAVVGRLRGGLALEGRKVSLATPTSAS